MLRNFKSAKGDGGAAGSVASAGAAAVVCDVEIDAVVGADRASASNFGVTATFVRTTMLVLTRMTDLRGDDCGRAFDCAADSAFASFTATTTDRLWPVLLHHFQKNQPEHARVATASRATSERRKEFGRRA